MSGKKDTKKEAKPKTEKLKPAEPAPEEKGLTVPGKKAVDLTPAQLTSASLAKFANFDLSQFSGIDLDIADNKEIFSNDILIPKVWLIQEMSDLRKEEKARSGEMVDSQTGEVLAERGGMLRFIVLKTFKRWHTFELVKKGADVKKEFLSSEVMIFGKNHDLKYQDVIDGKEIVRRQVISAIVLLERDVRHGTARPYIIDFASTSKLGGRVMVSDIATLNNNKLPSFAGFFEMTAEEESFEKGEAYVKKVKFGGYVAKEAIPFLVDARKNLATIENQIEFDDRDVLKGEDESATAETNVKGKADVASAKI